MAAVDGIKGGEGGAVNVEDGADGAVRGHEGNDNFRAGETAAGNVARKLLDIVDDYSLALLPCRSADAPAVGYVHARHGTLEGTKPQFLVPLTVTCRLASCSRRLYDIKACPEEIHRFVDGSTDISHDGDRIGLALDERRYLSLQQLVFLFLIHGCVIWFWLQKYKIRCR